MLGRLLLETLVPHACLAINSNHHSLHTTCLIQRSTMGGQPFLTPCLQCRNPSLPWVLTLPVPPQRGKDRLRLSQSQVARTRQAHACFPQPTIHCLFEYFIKKTTIYCLIRIWITIHEHTNTVKIRIKMREIGGKANNNKVIGGREQNQRSRDHGNREIRLIGYVQGGGGRGRHIQSRQSPNYCSHAARHQLYCRSASSTYLIAA